MHLTPFALLVPLAATATAQAPTPVLVEGDAVPGVGLVTSISHLALNDRGELLLEADTDQPDTDTDSVVLLDGALLYREGQALGAPAGALLGSFDSLSLNTAGQLGQNHFLDGVPAGADSGVYFDAQLLIQEGAPLVAAGITPGSPFLGFFDVKLNDAEELLLIATIDDPALPTSVDQVLLRLVVSGGALQSIDVIAKEGDLLPGQTEVVSTFGTSPHQSAFNDQGEVLFFADLGGATALDGVLYLGGTLLAQEGAPSPLAGRNWASLASPEVDLNDAGDFVFSGSLDGDSATNLLIVKNDAKFRQEGDSLPAIAPFLLTSFGSGPLSLANTGQVLWYGDWDDPDTDRDTGLFLDDELLVQEGVTTVGGVVVDTLRGVQDGYVLSRNARFVLFEAVLADGREGAFVIDLQLGTRYCSPAVANSTGLPASLAVTGVALAGGNPLRLSATDVPPGQFGYFLLSQTQANTPGAGGSQGVLCLAGQIGRFNAQVQSSGAAGYLEIAVDTLLVPLTPAVPILAGETFSFQCWYRDLNPTPTSNFTDGVAVLFL
jgi:hypothetical protein